MTEGSVTAFSLAAAGVEHLPDAILLTDSTGRVVAVNRRARILLGEGVVGRALSRVLAEFAVDEAPIWDEIIVLADHQDIALRGRSGGEFSARIFPWVPAQAAEGFVASITDVSEVNRLRRLQTACLSFLNHDMRSPAASLIALLDLCELAPERKPADFLDRVRRSASRALDAAADFLRLAEAGEWNFAEAGPVALGDVLLVAVDEAWPRAREEKVEITLAPSERETTIRGHYAWLVRAVTGLLNHAAKRSVTPGRVTCRLERRDPLTCVQVEYVARDPDEEDPAQMLERCGPLGAAGIPPMRAELFPLAAARTIVEKHAGRITALRPGAARTVFLLEFPAI